MNNDLPEKGFCPDCMFQGDISKFARMSKARLWIAGMEESDDQIGLGTCIECAEKEELKEKI